MPARRHRREDVIAAALGLLDERGLDAVSVREVARRMDVNVNSVSFQVGTKAQLLGLMSDAVLAELSLENLPGDELARAKEVLRRYRATLLKHRDAARLTAGNAPLQENTLVFAEVVTAALSAAGVPDRECITAMWALFYFLIGLTQEQQATQPDGADLGEALDSDRFPTLRRLGPDIVDLDFDERFEYGIDSLTSKFRGRPPNDD